MGSGRLDVRVLFNCDAPSEVKVLAKLVGAAQGHVLVRVRGAGGSDGTYSARS